MSHSFRARQKTVKHEDAERGNLHRIPLRRFGGFFSSMPLSHLWKQFSNIWRGWESQDHAYVWSSFPSSPSKGISLEAFKMSTIKSMQEPKSDWNDSWNEARNASFPLLVFVLVVWNKIYTGLSSATGLSEWLICNSAKVKTSFAKTKALSLQLLIWNTLLGQWSEQICSHWVVVVVWHCTWFFNFIYLFIFSWAPLYLATAQRVSGSWFSLLLSN